jgi:hypothetical protein
MWTCYCHSQVLELLHFWKDVLAFSKIWFCPIFWWRDTMIYLVFSVFSSRPTSLLVSNRISVLCIFYLCTASRTALGPTQPPILWVPGALSLGVKRPGREADHSPPSSAEVKNAWSYTSTPPYVFMAWCLVKHRDNFTLPLPFFTHCIKNISTDQELICSIRFQYFPIIVDLPDDILKQSWKAVTMKHLLVLDHSE